ncbi:hypothetical protein HS088_TW16G00174 [Tripterygium wilfordii]|uniref:Uncharacterized protein n=1 Tax=Tripterygium wilfordii TaxID=458696 RepID=A0A7J7CI62_TRIWF|nr:hypothetical protein HS088_TW16G00174 [Tripterygium wilfordii]
MVKRERFQRSRSHKISSSCGSVSLAGLVFFSSFFPLWFCWSNRVIYSKKPSNEVIALFNFKKRIRKYGIILKKKKKTREIITCTVELASFLPLVGWTVVD